MNKSHYKLYKKGKKWVITAVAATSIGIFDYALTNLNLVHADNVQLTNSESQPVVVNDSELYRMADSLSMAANNGVIENSASSNYESFKAALSAYEIIKSTYSTFYNDLGIIYQYNTGIPTYLTANRQQSLKLEFDELYPVMVETYYNHDNTKVLSAFTNYIDRLSNAPRLYIGSIVQPVGSIASKDSSLASSASVAIRDIIGSYNAMKTGSKYPQSSSASSLASSSGYLIDSVINSTAASKSSFKSVNSSAATSNATSDNIPNSNHSNDDSYWKNMANSLSAEINKRTTNDHNVQQVATPVNYSYKAESSAAASTNDSSAVSCAASSYNSSASSVYTSLTSSSASSNSNNSSKKNSNDVYKKLYLDLKKKAAKDISSNRYKVAKYKKAYKITKNKQQRAKKLKQYRDAKNKLNASKKYFKDLNTKLLKY